MNNNWNFDPGIAYTMKRMLPCLLAMAVMSVCYGSLSDVPQTADGYLTTGEYATLSITLEGNEELFVTGGGAECIDAKEFSYLEVRSTSIPINENWNAGGIRDITLYDNSKLLYLGGVTDEITVRDDAEAVLKGGTINAITIYHLSNWSSKVTLYCQDGYQRDGSGISGKWANGSPFDIDFINVGGIFSSYPTAHYVNIEIVPEPATVALLGLGGLLIRKRRP